jgi:hypothetical protein
MAVFYVIIYCGGIGICFALIIIIIIMLLTFLYIALGLKWQINNTNMNRYLIT